MFWFLWLTGGASLVAAALIIGNAVGTAVGRVDWYTAGEFVKNVPLLIYPIGLAFLGAPFLRLHSYMLALLVALGGGVVAAGGGAGIWQATPLLLRQHRSVPVSLTIGAAAAICIGAAWCLGLQPDDS